jgi:tripartite ATP-independent transporter DctM subunit
VTGIILVGVFMILCIGRVPVSLALFLSSLVAAFQADIPLIAVSQQFWGGLESFTLLAIPLFILSGTFMDKGGITAMIAKLSDTLVGHLRGSLGQVSVVCSMLLSGVSGSATADCAAIGSIFIPAMVREGYKRELAAGIVAASTTMGPIIPPSIIMVVYAATANVSVGALFLAGFGPGILVGLTQMGIIYYIARKTGLGSGHTISAFLTIIKEFGRCFPALLVPIIIIAGIAGGIFTATEAGMIAAAYCLLIAFFFYRTITLKDLPTLFRTAALNSAPALFCIGAACAFGWMLAYAGVPGAILRVISPFVNTPTEALLALTFLFIIVGCFMDALPAIVIFWPIVSALISSLNLDPLHVAILVAVVLSFGLMTPPYGITLLLASQMADVRPIAVSKLLFPFYLVFLVIVAVLIWLPDVALFLPRLLMPQAMGK